MLLTIFDNGTAHLDVNSSDRQPITYNGYIADKNNNHVYTFKSKINHYEINCNHLYFGNRMFIDHFLWQRRKGFFRLRQDGGFFKI